MRSVTKLFHLGLLISLSLGPAPPWAQNVATGVISGQVPDQTGAAIPGANVKLKEISTGSTTNTSTNETGRFTFPNGCARTCRISIRIRVDELIRC